LPPAIDISVRYVEDFIARFVLIALDGNRMLWTWKLHLLFLRGFFSSWSLLTAHEISVDEIYGKRDFSARELSTIGGE
jgi:hypothetical protein